MDLPVIAHPFHFVSGRIAPQTQGSAAHAAQLAGHVLSTQPGERPLAPAFGLTEQIGGVVDPASVAAALALCAPDLAVESVGVRQHTDGLVDVTVAVGWDQED